METAVSDDEENGRCGGFLWHGILLRGIGHQEKFTSARKMNPGESPVCPSCQKLSGDWANKYHAIANWTLPTYWLIMQKNDPATSVEEALGIDAMIMQIASVIGIAAELWHSYTMQLERSLIRT
jgi:hypothetical protein